MKSPTKLFLSSMLTGCLILSTNAVIASNEAKDKDEKFIAIVNSDKPLRDKYTSCINDKQNTNCCSETFKEYEKQCKKYYENQFTDSDMDTPP